MDALSGAARLPQEGSQPSANTEVSVSACPKRGGAKKNKKRKKERKKSTFPLSALSVLAQICSWFVEFALNQHLLPAQLMPSCAGNGTPRSCAALTAPQGQVLEGLNLFDT